MNSRIDRILELLDVGLQGTTPAHYGYGDIAPSHEPVWHDVTARVACSTESVPVQRYYGAVRLDQRRMQRDRRRDGKTTRAAARLATHRLRRALEAEGYTRVSDIELSINERMESDERDVAALCRIVHLPENVRPTGPIILPRGCWQFTFIQPRSILADDGRFFR